MEKPVKDVVRNISRNLVASFGNLIVTLIVGLVFPVFVIHNLGEKNYGSWVLVQSWLAIIQIPLIGINSSILSIAANQLQKPQEFRIFLKTYSLSAGGGIFFFFLICIPISFAMYMRSKEQYFSFDILIIFLISFLLNTLCEVAMLLAKTLQKYHLYYIQQNVYQIAFVSFALVLISWKPLIGSLAAASILSSLVRVAISIYLLLKVIPETGITWKELTDSKFSLYSLKEFLHLCQSDILSLLDGLNWNFLVRQIIPLAGGLQGLTYYELSTRISNQVFTPISIAFSNLIPSMVYLNNQSPSIFSSFLVKTHIYLSIAIIWTISFTTAFSSSVSNLFLSKSQPTFKILLIIITVTFGVNLSTGPLTNALIAIKKISLVKMKLICDITIAFLVTVLKIVFPQISFITYIFLLSFGMLVSVIWFYINFTKFNDLVNLKISIFLKKILLSVIIFFSCAYLAEWVITSSTLTIFTIHPIIHLCLGLFLFILLSIPSALIFGVLSWSEVTSILQKNIN